MPWTWAGLETCFDQQDFLKGTFSGLQRLGLRGMLFMTLARSEASLPY